MATHIRFWRRIDVQGIERLELSVGPDRIKAASSLICLEDGGFRLDHHWELAPSWRAHEVTVEQWSDQGHKRLRLQRAGSGWTVDGERRPDLDGAEEPDLSVTPFCNSFPILRVGQDVGQSLTLDTAYIDGAALTVARSSQRYDRQGPRRLRYVDLGLSRGFEADLLVDEMGLVISYEHLFERISPLSSSE